MSNADKKRPERILVLSGGGGRGAYQVGVCEVLAEKGWTPDVILGNSIGATNGAILAAPRVDAMPGISAVSSSAVELLKRVWLTEIAGNKLHRVSAEWPAFLGKVIQWVIALMQEAQEPTARDLFGDDELLDDLVDSLVDDDLDVQERSFGETGDGAIKKVLKRVFARAGGALKNLLSKEALMERRNWAALLDRYVDLGRLNDKDSGCPYLGVTSILAATGTLGYAWNSVPPGVDDEPTTLTVDHLMASSSIPGIYPATGIGPVYWWDGALSANTPVAPAIDILLHNSPHKTEIVVVLMTPYDEATVGAAPPTVLDALQRFLDWMMLASLPRELGRLDVEQREWVTIVAPSKLMGVVQIIDYGEQDVLALIEQGRKDAEAQL
jgi:NTE family protein